MEVPSPDQMPSSFNTSPSGQLSSGMNKNSAGSSMYGNQQMPMSDRSQSQASMELDGENEFTEIKMEPLSSQMFQYQPTPSTQQNVHNQNSMTYGLSPVDSGRGDAQQRQQSIF